MLCRVEMPTNEQTFGRFYRYQFVHASAEQGGGRGLLFMCIAVIVIAAISFFSGVMSWPALVLMLAAAAFIVYSMYIKPSSIFKRKSGVAMQTEVYLFAETSFTRSVRSEEGGLPENTSSRYDGLVKAVETKSDFYLFTGTTQAYLVDKQYFTNGTPEELRACLRTALDKKFISKQ